MNTPGKCIIGIIIIIAILFIVGTFWTTMETTTNMERINITQSCSIELPKDIQFDKTGGSDAEGTFIGLVSKNNDKWGRLIVDYEQSNNITYDTNQTKAFTDTVDGNTIYKCWVYDLSTHQKVEIRGDNPAIVEKVAQSVKFTNNTNNNTNTTVEHINNDTNQQSNTQQSNNNNVQPTQKTSNNEHKSAAEQAREEANAYSERIGSSDEVAQRRADAWAYYAEHGEPAPW